MTQLNMKDYKLVESYPYKRATRYEKFINEVKMNNQQKRLEKMNETKKEFDQEKERFFKERDQILLDIQKELNELGYRDIKFPLLNKVTES